MRHFQVGDVHVSGNNLFLIAGPCVIEDEKSCLEAAEFLAKFSEKQNVPLIFKASYDKANRSSVHSFRGVGIREGMRIFKEIRRSTNLPILTDIHSVEDVCKISGTVDVLQVPAFMCRQTDLVVAASGAIGSVNIKKGQFLSPWEMDNIIRKAESTGKKNIMITERGTSFGYNNLVSDMRSIEIMKSFGYPVVFDATHSVQMPGAGVNCSSGERHFAPLLARCAVAAGCSGVFLETYKDPDNAKCDGPNAVPWDWLEDIWAELKAVEYAVWKTKSRKFP